MKVQKMPEATIIRLSVYSRFLNKVERSEIKNISSAEIAEGTGGSPAQVRKDLAYFGDFGTRGVGYNVSRLNDSIKEILGINRPWRLVLIGAGNLGSALIHYQGFRDRGFDICAVFDNDVNKVGLAVNGVPIMPITRLNEYIDQNDIELAVITVPGKAAQDIADMLSETKIQGVLNLSPTSLILCDGIEVRNIDLTVNLEVLTFMISNQEDEHAY